MVTNEGTSEAMSETFANPMQHALVIEDQHLMRLALIQEMQEALPSSIVHGAANLSTAMDLLDSHQFDLILIDPGLPGYDPKSQIDRFAVVRTIVELSPDAIHCVVTGSDTDEEWEQCQRLGVAAYLAKNNLKSGALVGVLQQVALNGVCVRLTKETISPPEFYYSSLTPREQGVLDWMRQRPAGISRKEIYEQLGQRFGIDPASAEKFYKRARAKLLKTGLLPKGL
jgi:DNA-binding NarL/FixJ family response regulator